MLDVKSKKGLFVTYTEKKGVHLVAVTILKLLLQI